MEAQAQEAETLVAKSLTKKDALQNAIRAVELYMSAIELADPKSEKDRLRKKCKLLLQTAEEIKKSEIWPLVKKESPEVNLRVPISTRKLSKSEQLILLESSDLNGFLFPPWTSEPADSVFENVAEGETYYTESVDLRLSDIQRSIFSGWTRSERDNSNDLPRENLVLIPTDKEINLVQDITTDCSVVASLCVISSRASKGHGQLIASILYPKDNTSGLPRTSKNGKYICRFQFNGCFRKVTIDNRLPKSNTNHSLHVIDRNNLQLIWPALVEKAYLKLRGGYDFPGSNSGTDLWIISGWIPEQIFLQSDDTQIEQLWSRIFKAFCYGDVMITLGTGELTYKEENELGLVGQHDYAILDMKEFSSQRLFLVKNPWCNGIVWKELGDNNPKFPAERPAESIQELSLELSETATGTFWMDFESAVQNFEYLYLNWNPGLFRHRQDYHFDWIIPENKNSRLFIQNPQFSMKSSQKDTIWVLLSRHFSTDEQNISNTSKIKVSGALGYISLYIFETNGKKIYLSDNAIHRGAFMDSPQTLARITSSPSTVYTVSIAQQGLPLPKYSFTLVFFSRFPLVIDRVVEPAYSYKYSGVWSLRTAGGNASLPSYHKNPQYSISLSSNTDIDLVLETVEQDLAIHISMVWAGGNRIVAITSKDIVGDSGDYRCGCALASLKNVIAGKYTIVCSTFDADQAGEFTLHICSNTSCHVMPIMLETAGRLSFNFEPLIFQPNIYKMFASLTVVRLTRLRLVAKCVKISQKSNLSNFRPLLKLSIETGPKSNDRKVLCVSGGGKFSDAHRSLRLGDLDLTPNISHIGIWIVMERLSEIHCPDDTMIDVEVLSDNKVILGNWCIDGG
ncbi:Calpain-like protease palB [Erysiphe neolycopersici]|uniref:Calpain-like protease palB n=1 Tax=Erysiphe neolycopersici TaxID=212602 RepID=A0A420I0W7_9PEZI|nr:Calpain-like protease palB [Erysiphe neolycopersici]